MMMMHGDEPTNDGPPAGRTFVRRGAVLAALSLSRRSFLAKKAREGTKGTKGRTTNTVIGYVPRVD